MDKIIDISQWNVVTDWNAVKNNVDAVIIRMGYRGYSKGTLALDSKFKEYTAACAAHGIPYSVYFFPCSINDQEANEEADFILKNIEGMHLSLPVFLDSEVAGSKTDGRSDNLSVANRTRFLRIICERLEAAGIRSGVYASTSWLNNNLNMAELSQFITWCAHYKSKCTYKGAFALWQYTSKGLVAGIKGNADISKVTGALPAMDGKPIIVEPNTKIIASPYTVGKNYITQVNLYVRTSANGAKKNFMALTASGKQHAYKDAAGKVILKKGTTVTVQDVSILDNGQVWVKIPSGWICGIYNNGSVYVM